MSTATASQRHQAQVKVHFAGHDPKWFIIDRQRSCFLPMPGACPFSQRPLQGKTKTSGWGQSHRSGTHSPRSGPRLHPCYCLAVILPSPLQPSPLHLPCLFLRRHLWDRHHRQRGEEAGVPGSISRATAVNSPSPTASQRTDPAKLDVSAAGNSERSAAMLPRHFFQKPGAGRAPAVRADVLCNTRTHTPHQVGLLLSG